MTAQEEKSDSLDKSSGQQKLPLNAKDWDQVCKGRV